ncbi:MAG: glutamate racemase [Comamonadaceae bacterium]|nr:MAG: glutamate racemase [Comamonadaceae bacterium]
MDGATLPVGVFDSGVGGLSILRALRAAMPQEDFVYFSDAAHAPYGERDEAFVAQRALAITQDLVAQHGIKALVVACNTATAAAVGLLRAAHPSFPIVGVEPALKPAALLSATSRIAVFATRSTLASARFRALQRSLQAAASFVLQPCDGLAAAIEADDATETIALCARYISATGQFGSNPGQMDTLVLGCTHYPFAAPHLAPLLPKTVRLVETGEPVARQVARLLEARALLRSGNREGMLQLLSSGELEPLRSAAARWLGPAPA